MANRSTDTKANTFEIGQQVYLKKFGSDCGLIITVLSSDEIHTLCEVYNVRSHALAQQACEEGEPFALGTGRHTNIVKYYTSELEAVNGETSEVQAESRWDNLELS